ncbi:PAS domain S-box protein [Desulfobulbus rhabdoformis]|uniref:PAS domain-containing sensor histidine kinase n=1 Tax=Desulfobulbus rhabdoformis TaxID=34032 RepID=UPI0019653405|nr:PAS domain-containing sensor histidine kinase [Desulfobulbus rhabdoformis]MBM9616419.1 PAS domain S-box protein [Desulfobulbus rhabdoformis]
MSVPLSQQTGPVRRFLTIGFFALITILIGTLYLFNLYSLDTFHQNDLLRTQERLEEYGQSIALFLGERNNDLSVLAEAESVQQYLKQYTPALPQTVRHPSGEAIIQEFQQYNLKEEIFGRVFVSLSLMNPGGEEIVALHRPLEVSTKIDRQNSLVRTSSQVHLFVGEQGLLSLTHPVLVDGRIAGFVQGKLRYETLIKRLMPSMAGLLTLVNQRGIVYQSLPECRISVGLLQNLVQGQISPVEVNQSVGALAVKHPCISGSTHLYYADIPGYDLLLYFIDTNGTAQNYHQQQLFSSGFLLLSLCALAFVGFSHWFSLRKQNLLTTLDQARYAGKELQEKNQALELILKGAQLGTWNWNIVTGELELNDRFYTMLGYDPGELPAHLDTWKMLLHPDDREYVLPVLEAHLAGTTPFYSTEHRLRHKMGHWIWVLDIGQVLIRDNAGHGQRAFGVHLDISDRKEANRLLSKAKQESDTIERQKRYIEALFDVVSVGVVALTSNNDVVRRNSAFNGIIQKWSRLLTLDEQATSQLIVEGILREDTAEESFVFCLDRENIKGFFRCSVTYVSNCDGIATVLSVDDISRERLAEEAKRFLATLIEQTGEAVLVTGTDGIIDYANPACCTMTGYVFDELVGQKVSTFTEDLVDAEVLTAMRTTLEAGESWSGHLRSRKKDGSILEEETTISPIRNNLGETTHYVSIWHDITELVELQQQLSKAQKLESIGQLAAGIAHEINTPMQYVQNNVTFIEQSFEDVQPLLARLQACQLDILPVEIATEVDELDLDFLLDEVPTSIDETLQGINRVVKIISAMKEFSHPGDQEKVATDINHSLESSLIVCRNEWKYSAELITDLADDLPLVHCYVDQLHQALVNLVINASHAIEERKKSDPDTMGRITVSTRKHEDGVEIRISDNGAGIPDGVRSNIFEPFFTTKEVGKGTGQGLAIVYDVVVNRHGGKIDFESTTGQGTTFMLRLPVESTNEYVED